LTSDPEYLQYIGCDGVKFCTKFEWNRAIRSGVIAISIFDLMTLNMCRMLRWLCDNFHEVWSQSTYPLLAGNIFTADTLYRAVTHWPLTAWSWTCTVYRLLRAQTLCKIWAKSIKPLLSLS